MKPRKQLLISSIVLVHNTTVALAVCQPSSLCFAWQEPYKAAVEDCLIITMKGISAGMQNTG